jgi:hypothetical protein
MAVEKMDEFVSRIAGDSKDLRTEFNRMSGLLGSRVNEAMRISAAGRTKLQEEFDRFSENFTQRLDLLDERTTTRFEDMSSRVAKVEDWLASHAERPDEEFSPAIGGGVVQEDEDELTGFRAGLREAENRVRAHMRDAFSEATTNAVCRAVREGTASTARGSRLYPTRPIKDNPQG